MSGHWKGLLPVPHHLQAVISLELKNSKTFLPS